METLAETGLVVESRFTTRKRVIRDLQDGALVHDIIEAKSINDGLRYLKSSKVDACFLGPSLHEQVAIDFVKQGMVATKNRNCAFVAVINSAEREFAQPRNPGDSAAYLDALIRAGAHGTLRMPYVRRTLTEVVSRAVKKAAESSLMPDNQVNTNLRALDYSQNQLSRLASNLSIPLSHRIQCFSSGLRRVANDIENGRLVLRSTGEPSLATMDAIRMTLEEMLDEGTELTEYDRYFINSVVLWFADKTTQAHSRATEILRLRLLSYSGEQD